MALLKWSNEDDSKKKLDDLFGSSPVKRISSVQNSWQPTQANAAGDTSAMSNTQTNADGTQVQNDNYLLSDQKAQFDEQKRRNDAAEAAARAETARQADLARQQAAAQQAQQVTTDVAPPQIEPKSDAPIDKVGDFFQGIGEGLWKGGAGIIGSGASLISSAITGSAENDITKATQDWQKTADDWGRGVNADGAGEFIGSLPGGVVSGLVDPASYMVRGVRNTPEMLAASIAAGSSDPDIRRVGIEEQKKLQEKLFSKEVADRGDAAMLMEGLAKPGEAILNVATAGTASLPTAAAETAAKQVAKEASKQGAINLVGGVPLSLLEQGARGQEITPESIMRDAATQAILGAAVGGGSKYRAIRKGDNSIPTVDSPIESPVTPVTAIPKDSNVAFVDKLDNSNLPQIESTYHAPDASLTAPADGVVTAPNGATPVASGVPKIDRSGAETPLTPVTDIPKIAAADTTPVTPVTVNTVPTVADGVVRPNEILPVTDANTPTVKSEEVRALQEAKAGTSQADEAQINQKLQEIDSARPVDNSVPDGVDTPAVDVTLPDGKLTPAEFSQRFMPKLASSKDAKTQIANAVGMGKDVESDVREILSGGNIKPKKAERIAKQYDKFDKQLQEYNRLTEENQKGYTENGIEGISEETSRANRRAGREIGITMRRLQQEIKRLDISKDRKAQFFNNLSNALGTRNASVLTSAGLIERNMFQELTANAKLAIKNPVKMTKSTFGQGNILKDTAKAELSHWGDVPRSATEVVKYVVGNTYRTAMIPTTALANTRRGAVRQEFTRWAYDALQGGELSAKDAKKLSGTAGNEMEALVNTFTGVDNGMTNRGQAVDAMKAWKEYMKTGDQPIEINGVGTTTKAEYLKHVEQHNSLASQMLTGLSAKDQTKFRALKAMGDLIFPFVRTAKNLAVNAVQQDLNPMAKSLLDEIRVDQRSGGKNAVNLIKSKLVDYGIMGGAAALASSGAIVYNDGDEVDKPKGWSIKVGDNNYVPVRATSLELPIAMAGAAQAMFDDISNGKARDWKYYAGMITGSLPYIDQFNTTSGAVDSLANGEDAGYAAKAYAVNTAKGFVPFSNNGVQAYAAGKSGESLNAKTVYDDDLMTWFTNTVRKSYDPDFYNSLKDSRDNAGRVRTVDNQGVVSNKTMNDDSTREFNDRITDLVDYGREAGLGENTKDMFNTYDTGKNNNFKSIQDSITFLDAVDGKPDNTKKLEKNAKYTDLSNQIRDGFFGESGDELLTLDGKNLYSDVSVPNSSGSKNSRLPMNMQSIKNAIAQTDLPEDQRNRIYELSNSDTVLYNRLKSKEITYEQYSAEKAKTGQEYIDILSGSENYKKMTDLFDELDQSGFFEDGGLGSTRSGQTYLWNSLNTLLGSKGATPAANYPDASKSYTPYGRSGSGLNATNKPGDRKNTGIKWSPVANRQMASVASGKYTPVSIKVKLGNGIKKDRSQNYADRTF